MSTARTYSSDIAFTPAVKAIQAGKGSRDAYARMEAAGSWKTRITPDLVAFIAAQTSIFFATANNEGQPVVSGWAFGAAERAETKAPPRTARQRASERRRRRACGECMGSWISRLGKRKEECGARQSERVPGHGTARTETVVGNTGGGQRLLFPWLEEEAHFGRQREVPWWGGRPTKPFLMVWNERVRGAVRGRGRGAASG